MQFFGRDGSGVHPHAHDANLQFGTMALKQFVYKRPCGKNIKHAGLQRNDDLVSHFHHVVKAPAVQASGRVQHHMRGALGRAGYVVG